MWSDINCPVPVIYATLNPLGSQLAALTIGIISLFSIPYVLCSPSAHIMTHYKSLNCFCFSSKNMVVLSRKRRWHTSSTNLPLALSSNTCHFLWDCMVHHYAQLCHEHSTEDRRMVHREEQPWNNCGDKPSNLLRPFQTHLLKSRILVGNCWK